MNPSPKQFINYNFDRKIIDKMVDPKGYNREYKRWRKERERALIVEITKNKLKKKQKPQPNINKTKTIKTTIDEASVFINILTKNNVKFKCDFGIEEARFTI